MFTESNQSIILTAPLRYQGSAIATMTLRGRPIKMLAMAFRFLRLLILCTSCAGLLYAEENPLEMHATFDRSPIIGRIRNMTFEIENKSTNTLAILEISPEQPCEEPIDLIRPVIGEIHYNDETDEYAQESLIQKESQISLIEGLLLPNDKLELPVKYRPYAPTETFNITYAVVGFNKIYRFKKSEGSRSIYSPAGADDRRVLLPQLFRMPQSSVRVKVVFDSVRGKKNEYCFCETLNRFVDLPPYSIYKDWDSGNSAQFRVGEKQEGSGPEKHPAGWKFLDAFEVFYGDGMYTHGEFIEVSPDQAKDFMTRAGKKYFIKKVHYFLDRYYYDLEPVP